MLQRLLFVPLLCLLFFDPVRRILYIRCICMHCYTCLHCVLRKLSWMKYACTYELSLSKIIITKANMGRQCGNIVHLILKFYKNKPFNIVISFFLNWIHVQCFHPNIVWLNRFYVLFIWTLHKILLFLLRVSIPPCRCACASIINRSNTNVASASRVNLWSRFTFWVDYGFTFSEVESDRYCTEFRKFGFI